MITEKPWELRAEPSPLFDIDRKWSSWVGVSLLVHLSFSVPTTLLWAFVITQALRKFPRVPEPNEYSPRHIFWARLAALEMVMTAVTGWLFYWLAFVLE